MRNSKIYANKKILTSLYPIFKKQSPFIIYLNNKIMRYTINSGPSKYKKLALMLTIAVHVGFFGAMALSGTTDKDDQIIEQVKEWFNKDDVEKKDTKKAKQRHA